MGETIGLWLDLTKDGYEEFEFEETGYHTTPKRYYVNDFINIAVNGNDEIIAVSIWQKAIKDLGVDGIKRVEIGFGDVNVWRDDAYYSNAGDVLKDLYKVLDVRLGQFNSDYIADSGEYTVRLF